MKNRTLILLSASFAVLVLFRAVAVSSELSAKPKTSQNAEHIETPALDAKETHLESSPTPHLTQDTHADKQDTQSAPPSDQQCLTPSLHEIVAADMARNQKKSLELAKREAALAKLKTSLNSQLAQIETANDNLATQIEEMQTIANADITHLVKMYETMKPKQASQIFNSMDPAFAAGFLRKMKSDTASLIMANMDARKSYAISLIIAGKNANYRQK